MECLLTLKVGQEGEEQEILTVPQIMANASPVFRSMLQPGRFAEGQSLPNAEPFVIPLPDDNPQALVILCDVFHLRSSEVPVKHMTSDTMAEIATLADKYDCAAAVQPWPTLWLAEMMSRKELQDYQSLSLAEVSKWIHISCQLGLAKQFTRLTSALVCRANSTDFSQGPLLLNFQKLSQKIQDSIEEARDAAILAYYQLCYNLIEDLKQGKHCKVLAHNSSYDDPDRVDKLQDGFNCSSMIFGNAMLAARYICDGGTWEVVEDWVESIEYYHERMRKFASLLNGPRRIINNDDHAYPNQRYGYNSVVGSHKNCSLGDQVLAEVQEIYQTATKGLELDVVGNHVYRTFALPSGGPAPQPLAVKKGKKPRRCQLPD